MVRLSSFIDRIFDHGAEFYSSGYGRIEVEGADIFRLSPTGQLRDGYGMIIIHGPIPTICRTGITKYFLSMIIMRVQWLIIRHGTIHGTFLKN